MHAATWLDWLGTGDYTFAREALQRGVAAIFAVAFLSAVDHVQLDRLRYQVMLALDAVFADVDAMIGPYSTGPMLVASNFTGHPCLHLRSGFADRPTRPPGSISAIRQQPETAPDAPTFRVPQGISLWGRLFEEGPLLNLGMALERELDVAALRPTFAR